MIGDPPHSIDAEVSFLEGALFDRNAIEFGIDISLAPEDFYRKNHGILWKAILALYDQRKPVDMVTVGTYLMEKNDIEHPSTFISDIASGRGGTSFNAPYYAQIVKDKSIRRGLIESASEIATLGYQEALDIDTMLDKAENALKRTKDKSPTTGRDPAPDDIISRMEGEKASGLPTRLPLLNSISTGMVRSHLWVIGGFTSTGKSAVACNLMDDAIRAGGSVMVASTEMSQEQYMLRLLSLSSGIPQRVIRQGGMTLEEATQYNVAKDFWRSAKIRIFDDLYSTARIRRMAKKVKETVGLDVLMVDFIQNLNESAGDEVKDARLAAINLQALAKELNCTVIALSQISNSQAQAQAENGVQGGYFAFRGSGAIAAAADLAVMLDRDRVNKPDVLIWNVVKNRHDRLARIYTRINLEVGRIEQMSEEEALDADPNSGRRSRRRNDDV